jgi:hypothetical protein
VSKLGVGFPFSLYRARLLLAQIDMGRNGSCR